MFTRKNESLHSRLFGCALNQKERRISFIKIFSLQANLDEYPAQTIHNSCKLIRHAKLNPQVQKNNKLDSQKSLEEQVVVVQWQEKNVKEAREETEEKSLKIVRCTGKGKRWKGNMREGSREGMRGTVLTIMRGEDRLKSNTPLVLQTTIVAVEVSGPSLGWAGVLGMVIYLS